MTQTFPAPPASTQPGAPHHRPSLESLRRQFGETVAHIGNDIDRLLPAWARDGADTLLRRRKLIICGSQDRAEIRRLVRSCEVVAIVDDFLCRKQSTLCGVPVIDADQWIERVRADRSLLSLLLVMEPVPYEYFQRLCRQWGIEHLNPLQLMHLLRRHGISLSGEAGRYFCMGLGFVEHTLANADALAAFASKLEDDYSRFSWFCILMYRLTLDPAYLSACAVGTNADAFRLNSYAVNRQFFSFGPDEVYVDGGPYLGDTVEQFIRAVGGDFRHIHSFEPVAANNTEIRKRLYTLQNEYARDFAGRITLSDKGLWSSEATLHFNPGGVINPFDAHNRVLPNAAHLVEAGMLGHVYDAATEQAASVKVPVTSIDRATNGDASFIKLEIEGAELEALKGAVDTIRRNRPQMALSVYHKPEDLTAIPGFLAELDSPYRLGFRQHYPTVMAATVLYCYR